MRRLWSIAVVSLVVVLAPVGSAPACPSCRDAVPSTTDADEDDQMRESRAYNTSIYLMAGMPYLLLGAVGFGIYRCTRNRGEFPRY